MEIKFKDIVFDPQVQNLCVDTDFKCPNYNKYWACPPKAPYMEKRVSKYTKIYLIYIKFDIKAHIEEEKKKTPNKTEISIKNEFYTNNYMREEMEKEINAFLANFQQIYNEKLILWDGHCLLCQNQGFKKCSLEERLPCRFPDEIRYSMESVGIHVTKTVKNLNLPIEWPPENYCYRFGLICFKGVD
ncbi:MAG: DUF2284 domain-containing protein [Candidatus Lokiarchaeota archaeon]